MKGVAHFTVSIYNGHHMSGDTPEPTKKRGSKSGAKTDDKSGSQEERFLRAFDEHADALFRHATVRLSDRERAVELVHDSFTKVWGYIRSGHEIDSFRPFLYKVLNNLIIDEYRKRRESSLDAIFEKEGIDESAFEELHDHSHEALINSLDAKRAVAVVSELPDVYREVITLRFVDGLGPKEISLLVEETENVVSVRLHRGIKLMKELIEKKIAKEDT